MIRSVDFEKLISANLCRYGTFTISSPRQQVSVVQSLLIAWARLKGNCECEYLQSQRGHSKEIVFNKYKKFNTKIFNIILFLQIYFMISNYITVAQHGRRNTVSLAKQVEQQVWLNRHQTRTYLLVNLKCSELTIFDCNYHVRDGHRLPAHSVNGECWLNIGITKKRLSLPTDSF